MLLSARGAWSSDFLHGTSPCVNMRSDYNLKIMLQLQLSIPARKRLWLLASDRGHKTGRESQKMGFRVKTRKGTRSGEKSSGRGSVPAWPWAEGADAGEHRQAPFPLLPSLTSAVGPPAVTPLQPWMLWAGDHLQDAFRFKSKTLDRQHMHTDWGFSETKHSVL